MSNVIPGPGYGPHAGALENHGTPPTGAAGRPIHLYSDAMDSAVTAFAMGGFTKDNAETMMREKIAAAIAAYLSENKL